MGPQVSAIAVPLGEIHCIFCNNLADFRIWVRCNRIPFTYQRRAARLFSPPDARRFDSPDRNSGRLLPACLLPAAHPPCCRPYWPGLRLRHCAPGWVRRREPAGRRLTYQAARQRARRGHHSPPPPNGGRVSITFQQLGPTVWRRL